MKLTQKTEKIALGVLVNFSDVSLIENRPITPRFALSLVNAIMMLCFSSDRLLSY